jgi:lysozyme
LYDVRPIAAAVNELTYTPLTQNQFDALVAFAFNVGVDNFRRSAALRRVNEGALIEAACALEMWRKADFEGERIVVDALVRRRAAEKALFLTPSDGWVPAPSPILRPKVDYDVGQALPKASTALETSMTGDVAEARRAPPEASASLAAADAVSARLNEILPEALAAPTPEPQSAAPTPAPAQAVAVPPPAHVAEAGLQPTSTAAPALFSALFGLESMPAEPAAFAEPPTVEAPVAEPSVQPPLADTAGAEATDPFRLSEPAQPAIEAAQPVEAEQPQFDLPEHEPADLSRRVVWREAPMETEASRLLGGGFKGLSPLWLALLFLVGIAVFAGGIMWGWSTKGSGLVSWLLGLTGIVCVAGSVYVYLEQLGEREE